MKYYVMITECGKHYGVPAEIIAKHKADYRAKRNGDSADIWQDTFVAMMNWFDGDDFEFADWAKNNMNWSDVSAHAKLLKTNDPTIDFQESWVNGEYEYHITDTTTEG